MYIINTSKTTTTGIREWGSKLTLNNTKGDREMHYETWAIVLMGLGGLSLWALLAMMVMSVLIAGSKADDLMGDKQYE